MKTKLTILFSTLAMAITGAVLLNVSTAQAGIRSFPAPVGCEERFCGSHCQHHCHYWSCGEREFYCPGHHHHGG